MACKAARAHRLYRAGLTSADDAFSAFDKEIGAVRDSLHDISELLEDALSVIKAKFQQVILCASSRRNRLPPISRLPVEVLRNIFQLVSSCGLHHTRNIAITSVCTYWRSVVLHDAKVWTVVDFTRVGRRYASMAVERSSPLPLHVLGCESLNSRQWAPSIIATNLSRVQRLELDFDMAKTKLQAPFDGVQAPILTHLRLRGAINYWTSDLYFHPLLLVHSPRLRYLDLLDCPFPLNTGMYEGLTTLKIEIDGLDTHLSSYFPGGDVAVVVRECPRLEHLVIDFNYQGADDRAPVIVEETEMRSLHDLVLKLPEQYLVYLMKCLVLPSVDNIHLTSYDCTKPNRVAALFRPHRISDTLFSAVGALGTYMKGNKYTLQAYTTPTRTNLILTVDLEMVGAWEAPQDLLVEHPFKLLLSAIRKNYALPKLERVRFGGKRGDNDFHDRQWPGYTREMALFMVHNPTIRVVSFNIYSTRRYTRSLDEVRTTLSGVLTSSGVWPLPNLLNCSFSSRGSGSNCEPCTTGILRFLKFVTSHKSLPTSQIRCGTIVVAERRSAVEFIRGVRALRIPFFYWTGTYFEIDEGPWCTAAPGDLWPRRAKYNWRCENDTAHLSGTTSVVNCCRGRNPRTAHDYFDSTPKVADMYSIARDWAALLDAQSNDTIVQ